MDYGRMAELTLRVQHRHSDGSWGSLEPQPSSAHDPADLDPERDWSNTTLFRCKTCDEQVLVSHPDDPAVPR
jgi:hypothetical protein